MTDSAPLNVLRQKLQHRPNAPAAAHHLACVLLRDDPGPHRLDELPAYVQDEAAGIAVARTRVDVKRHLDLCAECSAQYLMLLQTVLAETEGRVSRPAKIPRPNLSFLPSPPLTDVARQIAEQILGRLAPHQLPNLERVVGLFVQRLAAVGSAPDLRLAYKPSLSSEPIEAFQVFVFAYYTSRALQTEPAASAANWDTAVASATQSIGRQMQLSQPVAGTLAQAYAANVAEWRAYLRPES